MDTLYEFIPLDHKYLLNFFLNIYHILFIIVLFFFCKYKKCDLVYIFFFDLNIYINVNEFKNIDIF